MPSRTAQITISTATSACRAVIPPDQSDGASAPAQPTAPRPKVQVVSIQPEFLVLRQASHAPLMTSASATLTAIRIARNVSAVMTLPADEYGGTAARQAHNECHASLRHLA